MNNLKKEETNSLPEEESIIIHDSLSSQKKEILLEKNRTINLYLCGPTVYSNVHVGNLRAVIFFDVITRTLREKNMTYRYIQNITDVDDKIIKQSALEGKSETLLTKHYIRKYKQVLEKLNIISPEFCSVTKNIKTIVNFVRRLVTNGNAYVEEGDVLFSIGKNSQEYGKLSKQLIDKLSRKGGRKIHEQQKRSKGDFILWKKTEEGISWKTEWSVGRPGWHSECAAIIDRIFKGKRIDIHGGGKDLLFPHHENERIQYVTANNCEISRIWLHFGFVLSQNTKMSKSEGNYITAENFIEKYNGNTLRMLLLESRYSEDIEVSEEVIKQAASRVKKIENVMKKISLFFHFNNLQREKLNYDKKEEVLRLLLNNLETTKVLNILEKSLSFINKEIDNVKKQTELEIAINDFLFSLEIMGFNFQVRRYDLETKAVLQSWKKLSAQGAYEEADRLREVLQRNAVI